MVPVLQELAACQLSWLQVHPPAERRLLFRVRAAHRLHANGGPGNEEHSRIRPLGNRDVFGHYRPARDRCDLRCADGASPSHSAPPTCYPSRCHRRRVLVVFAIGGTKLLELLHVSMPAFEVAAGILLLLQSIELIFAHPGGLSTLTTGEEREAEHSDEIAVFPFFLSPYR